MLARGPTDSSGGRAVLHHVIHGGRVRYALLDDVERLAQHGQLQAVAHKAQRFLLDLCRLLADLGHEVEGDVHHLRIGLFTRHHFDQRHQLRGVPEVRHHEALGVPHHRLQRGGAQAGGVRGQNRVLGGGVLHFGPDGLLDVKVLGHGFDDEVHVRHAARIVGVTGDAASTVSTVSPA